MPGIFGMHEKVTQAICNYPAKVIEWLEANLTQDEVDSMELAIVPPPTEAEIAQGLYSMGNFVKWVGAETFAQKVKVPVEALQSMLAEGTQAADEIVSASTAPTLPIEQPTSEAPPADPAPAEQPPA